MQKRWLLGGIAAYLYVAGLRTEATVSVPDCGNHDRIYVAL